MATVGDVVLYGIGGGPTAAVKFGGTSTDTALAAIVTADRGNGRVNLTAFRPDGVPHALHNVAQGDPGTSGAWWPRA